MIHKKKKKKEFNYSRDSQNVIFNNLIIVNISMIFHDMQVFFVSVLSVFKITHLF